MNDIYLVGTGAFEMVLLEDNQATIRILESGRSPAFRHTDKTQRLILAWLAEQFGRRHFVLVYVASILQAADIFTKPLVTPRNGISSSSCLPLSRLPKLSSARLKRKCKAKGNLLPSWHRPDLRGSSLKCVADRTRS